MKILIADDHQLFRDGLKATLKKIDFVETVITAESGLDAISQFEQNPDTAVILMDIEMPEMNGIEASKQLLAKYPDIKIFALTMHTSSRYIMELYDIGVNGYILKNTNKQELTKALDHAKQGEQYYSKDVQETLFKTLLNRDKGTKSMDAPLKISAREIEILTLICEQYSSEEIADRLFISAKTVKRHRQILFEKTGSKNLAGLVVFAIQNNYFKVYN
jgi:DNA-binding NarL/FixJ family response regulator